MAKKKTNQMKVTQMVKKKNTRTTPTLTCSRTKKPPRSPWIPKKTAITGVRPGAAPAFAAATQNFAEAAAAFVGEFDDPDEFVAATGAEFAAW